MLRALLRTLSCDRRTSFGEPVEPDVLSSSARSGCRSWAERSRRSVELPPVARRREHDVGVVAAVSGVEVAAWSPGTSSAG